MSTLKLELDTMSMILWKYPQLQVPEHVFCGSEFIIISVLPKDDTRLLSDTNKTFSDNPITIN